MVNRRKKQWNSQDQEDRPPKARRRGPGRERAGDGGQDNQPPGKGPRQKKSQKVQAIILIALAGFLIFFFPQLLKGNGEESEKLPEPDVSVEKIYIPKYEDLPKHYDPFDSPSDLVQSLYKYSYLEYTDDEIHMIDREPGVLEFLLRSHHGYKPEKWDHQFELSEEHPVGDVFPHFIQWDERWAFETYAGSQFGLSGCGPTCLSMIYTGLTGKNDYPPDRMGEFAEKNGYAVDGKGTTWDFFEFGSRQLGLKSRPMKLDMASFKKALDSGELIVVLFGQGDFTRSGHFSILWSYEGDQFNILDPFNIRLTEDSWSYSDLGKQIGSAWAIGK